MNTKNEPFWKWLVKKVSHKRPMLVKVADVRAKMTDVEHKMAIVLAEAISPKDESGRYKNSLIDFIQIDRSDFGRTKHWKVGDAW